VAASRLSDKLVPLLQDAMDKVQEDVEWEITLLPTPEMGTMLYIGMWAKSPILGQTINTGASIGSPTDLTPSQADEIVNVMLEQIAQARTNVLAQGGEDEPAIDPGAPGGPPGGNGLTP
jgi:hypothetical protein